MTETHIIETDEGIVREFEVKPPSTSALICYPVEWLPKSEPPGHHYHVTVLYIPNVDPWHDEETEVEFHGYSKEAILDALRTPPYWKSYTYAENPDFNLYRVADVTGVDAFGPDQNVPVLRVGIGAYKDAHGHTSNTRDEVLMYSHLKVSRLLQKAGIHHPREYTGEYGYKPHCTVPLPMAFNPPKHVLLRPMELWYKDDEPVVL